MNRTTIALAALFAFACSTYQTPECYPACGRPEQLFFARCVANGLAGVCQAGNRRCCALESHCIGALDDQTVQATRTCEVFEETECFPACTEADQADFALCVTNGAAMCGSGDDECCALAVDCLGTLHDERAGVDVAVTAPGCCTDDTDCGEADRCNPATSTCVPDVSGAGCGDGVVEATEGCDDHNTVTEVCAYGMRSCTVCASDCALVAGATSFCGDSRVDPAGGEECDAPGTRACDPFCHRAAPPGCSNGAQDGLESDVDCGGPECPPCMLMQRCNVPMDCAPAHPECGAIPMCLTDQICSELVTCDDRMICTRDTCAPGLGCSSIAIDDDSDTFGPLDLGCGPDCDDTRADVSPRAPEVCDGVDNDCDMLIDETC